MHNRIINHRSLKFKSNRIKRRYYFSIKSTLCHFFFTVQLVRLAIILYEYGVYQPPPDDHPLFPPPDDHPELPPPPDDHPLPPE